MMDDEEADLREQIFHNNVREQIIFLLLFILLYLLSFMLIEKFRRRDSEDYFTADEEEVKVYRISLWLCTFALAVSLGSALLLPVSIVSNEVLILYPNSYYVKWLNSSLIQGLWNHVFLFSNLSLFVFLPFAYLFSESTGFQGCRGLKGRVYETFIVLALLGIAMLGLAYVISAWLEGDRSSIDALLNLWTYLPFLYSCVSFVGVLMLLVFTPLGFVRLFGVVGGVLVKPQFLRDLNEEYYVYSFEEDTIRRRFNNSVATGVSYISPDPTYPDRGDISAPINSDVSTLKEKIVSTEGKETPLLRLRNGALQAGLNERLQRVVAMRKEVENQRKTSSLQRNVVYPLAMLLLLALTTITVLMVLQNTLELLIGIKAVPLSTRQFTLGITSLSKLGWAGATLEAFLILYLHAASLTGLSTPMRALRVLPRARRTPLTRIIALCAVLLAHSTAQPLLVKILGITNFDLLGEFGRIEWLGNFKLVLLYNAIFAATVTLCLVSKFTASVRRELYNRMGVKYIIAGESQCNLFAQICLVGDYLAQNLPDFQYDRIEKSVADWKPWLCKINQKNKWHHIGSPIVWKELLMAGSKPSYIGCASEFLEYCHSYYKFDVFLSSKIFENLVENYGQFQRKVKREIESTTGQDKSKIIEVSLKNKSTVCISGAGNPLALFIMSGLLDNDIKKSISKIYIYDEKCSQNLMNFVESECCYIGTDHFGKIVKHVEKLGVALSSTDLFIILDYIPFRSTYSIGEWLYKNKKVMENIAVIINATAPPKMYVVLPNIGPACYNATILAECITKINKNNIVVATSDLGLEIASVAADIADVPMKNMFCSPVWGFVGINHLVDIRTTIHKYNSFDPYSRYSKVRNSTLCIGTLTPEMRTMEYLMCWDKSLWKTVADRKLQKKMSDRPLSINKAIAVLGLVKIWLFDPSPKYIVNLGIQCDGSFGLTFSGVFSQPAHLVNGEWRPASGYLLPRDPQMNISYLQQIAEIMMTLKRTDLAQVVQYTPCICKVKKSPKKYAW